MNSYTLQIKFKSDTSMGSGQGFGAILDHDIVFDDMGIPYIPAKRMKGCLRETAKEVQNMLELSGLGKNIVDVTKTFGCSGLKMPAPVYFDNFYIPDFQNNVNWLQFFLHSEKYSPFISMENIIDSYTTIRQQTSIDPNTGTAKTNSLRNMRVINKGMIFEGMVRIPKDDHLIERTLALSCLGLKRIGTKRNRGLGAVTCFLLDGKKNISQIRWEELKKQCTK